MLTICATDLFQAVMILKLPNKIIKIAYQDNEVLDLST
jgi:hypothetical protein